MRAKIRLEVEPSPRELVPDFLENRRRDLERMRRALQAGLQGKLADYLARVEIG